MPPDEIVAAVAVVIAAGLDRPEEITADRSARGDDAVGPHQPEVDRAGDGVAPGKVGDSVGVEITHRGDRPAGVAAEVPPPDDGSCGVGQPSLEGAVGELPDRVGGAVAIEIDAVADEARQGELDDRPDKVHRRADVRRPSRGHPPIDRDRRLLIDERVAAAAAVEETREDDVRAGEQEPIVGRAADHGFDRRSRVRRGGAGGRDGDAPQPHLERGVHGREVHSVGALGGEFFDGVGPEQIGELVAVVPLAADESVARESAAERVVPLAAEDRVVAVAAVEEVVAGRSGERVGVGAPLEPDTEGAAAEPIGPRSTDDMPEVDDPAGGRGLGERSGIDHRAEVDGHRRRPGAVVERVEGIATAGRESTAVEDSGEGDPARETESIAPAASADPIDAGGRQRRHGRRAGGGGHPAVDGEGEEEAAAGGGEVHPIGALPGGLRNGVDRAGIGKLVDVVVEPAGEGVDAGGGREEVIPGAADERVVAGSPLEPIVTGAAVERVGTASAIERVRRGISGEEIAPGSATNDRNPGDPRRGRGGAGGEVDDDARLPRDPRGRGIDVGKRVLADSGVDPRRRRRGIADHDGVAAGAEDHRLEGIVGEARRGAGGPADDRPLQGTSDPHRLGCIDPAGIEGVAATTGEFDDPVAAAGDDDEGVVVPPAAERVAAGAAEERVVAATAVERVVVAVPDDPVSGGAAGEKIVPRPPDDRQRAAETAPVKLVGRGAAGEEGFLDRGHGVRSPRFPTAVGKWLPDVEDAIGEPGRGIGEEHEGVEPRPAVERVGLRPRGHLIKLPAE